MVDNIVEAAARILADRGWARLTTNDVAQVAGVSVGSLYQYFPNKLALVEAIRQRHLSAVLAALSDTGGWDEASTVDQHTVRLIDGIVSAHSINPALHRVLLEEVPPVLRSSDDLFEMEYQRRYVEFVRSISGKGTSDDASIAASVLAAAVEGVVHMAARQGRLASSALKSELHNLVCGYLSHRISNGREQSASNTDI